MKRRSSFRNIVSVWRGDFKRLTGSVVALVIMFGLCVVPCLYAWFNIFSNWDPYGPGATSRIRVAVSTNDAGTDLLGLQINVGDQVVDGLKANSSIGWVFVDTDEEAISRVDSGDCYAALVIPEDFTNNVVSFIALDFRHPEIVYYENQKKNAIAPKITGKAKTAVQEQVNATFAETIASDLASVIGVLDENGVDYETTVKNLSAKLTDLDAKLDEADGLLGSICRLLNATEQLMYYSSVLTGDVANTAYQTANLSSTMAYDTALLNVRIDELNTELKRMLEESDSNLKTVSDSLNNGLATGNTADSAVLAADAEIVDQMKNSLQDIDPAVAARLEEIGNKLRQASREDITDELKNSILSDLPDLILDCRSLVMRELYEAVTELTPKLNYSLNSVAGAAQSAASAFGSVGGSASEISATFGSLTTPLSNMEYDLYKTRENLVKAREKIDEVSKTLDGLAESEFLKELTGSIQENRDQLAPYFASPIRMNTVVLYPIENYGSAMAPFYTVLSQWVGALFAIALMKARVRREDMTVPLSPGEEFFGRMPVFVNVCLIQAIVTAVGDLYYVGIYCLHPGLFFLAAVVTGLCFALINYALLFALEKIGLGASVIIMVIQVAGAGGSYPVEVVPKVFRTLYPFMPFNYAMNAMREAIGGTYGTNYTKDIVILLLISLLFVVLGLALYKPVHWLNRLIADSSEKAEIMC